MSSPDWGVSEKKRRRFTEDDEDDYKYRREPGDKSNRQSSDSFSRAHQSMDFKRALSPEEDFKYKKTTQDFRHRYRQEDFTYKQQHDVLTRRRSSGYYRERDCRSRDHSEERTRSQDRFTKTYAREGNDSPSTDCEDHRQNRTRFPLNGSSGQSFESDITNHSPEQKSSSKGFQRFLDVLNKGVNVAMLTKIVTQTSAEDDGPCSPTSFMNTADRPWSPSAAGSAQGSHQNTSHWRESKGPQRLSSPQPCHRPLSPRGRPLFDEKPLQRGEGERSYFSSNSRSRSPSVVEKKVLTPEDEHKHRQMQDVLQAIGMDLGFEELGQMSHRIQERLYGKKDGDTGRHRRASRERDTKRAFFPRLQSRSSSSSSRSSISPSTQKHYMNTDSYSAPRDVPEVDRVEVQEAVEHGQNSSSSTLQESEKSQMKSQETTAASQSFSQNPTYKLSEPSPAPLIPMYSPVNCSPLPYPALPPVLPPNLPLVGPGFFLPRLPPFFPYPRVPPLNILPAMLAQTRHLLPQHIGNPQPLLNLPDMNRIQPLNNTQKSKPLSRPRCLQVIETKQPG